MAVAASGILKFQWESIWSRNADTGSLPRCGVKPRAGLRGAIRNSNAAFDIRILRPLTPFPRRQRSCAEALVNRVKRLTTQFVARGLL